MQSSLVLCQDVNVMCGKGSYIEFCSGKETNRIAWLLIGDGKWEESGKTDKGSCPFYLGKKDVKTGSELIKLSSSASVLILGFFSG